MIGVLVCLFPAAVMVVSPSSAADAPAVVVGRVYHIEGDLLRYVPKDNDWVAMVQERAKRSKEGTVNREARIEPPKTTNYIVPAIK